MTAPDSNYWHDWWNARGRQDTGNDEVDRGTTVRLDAVTRRARARLLADLDPQPTDVLLDAGCGSGVNLRFFHGRVARLTGMDFAEEMLKRAEARLGAEGLAGVELRLGSVAALPFAAGQFDKVLCASVLQYLDDAACMAALRELLRVCRPGGRVVLHVKNRTSLYGLSLRVLRAVARVLGKPTRPGVYRPRTWYRRALAQAGGRVLGEDGFGVLTFVPLPGRVVQALLALECRLLGAGGLRRFGVNYSLTVTPAR